MEVQRKKKEKRNDLSVKLMMSRLDRKDKVPIEVLDISKAGIGFICNEVLDKGLSV